jgi:hypothetical protein
MLRLKSTKLIPYSFQSRLLFIDHMVQINKLKKSFQMISATHLKSDGFKSKLCDISDKLYRMKSALQKL